MLHALVEKGVDIGTKDYLKPRCKKDIHPIKNDVEDPPKEERNKSNKG